MASFDDARELLSHARHEFPKIRKAYAESLEAKEVKRPLLVEIKNLLENLRSALDFAARGVFELHGSSTQAKRNIYFPYARLDQNRTDFEKSKRIETCIPGLTRSRPDIVDAFMEMQHFGARAYPWLPEFMDLNNENKHERLTPQTRRETKELRISSGGTSISMGEGTSISMGPGTSISFGGRGVIRGGQVFDVNRPPRVEGPASVEVIRWVSFHFDSNGQPVISFLETAGEGVQSIVDELRKL